MTLELTSDRGDRDATATLPLVLVVAERVIHDALSALSDLNVHPVVFSSYESFMVALEERTVPMHAHPTVVVCSAGLPDDSVGLAGLLHVVGDFMVVVGGDTPRSIAAPPTVNRLRAAIAATSVEQGSAVELVDVPRGDARIVDMTAVRDLRSVLGVGQPGQPRSTRRLANQINPAVISRSPAPQTRTPTTPSVTRSASSPARPSQLVASRPRLSATISQLDPDLMPGPQVLCVYGPKSGVGKTTIATNLAARLAHHAGLRVLVVDLDVASPAIGFRLRRESPTVVDALNDPELSRDTLIRWIHQEPTSGFWALLGPPRHPERDAPDRELLSPAGYRRVLSAALDFDAVVLDCPADLSDPLVCRFGLEVADTICVVVNNDRATLIDARRDLDTMTHARQDPGRTGYGIDRSKLALLFNQRLEGVGMDLNELRGMLDGYALAATFPDDRQLHVAAANAGQMVALSGPDEVMAALDEALGALLPGLGPLPAWRSADQLARLQRDLDRPTGLLSWVRQAIRQEARP